MSFDELLTTPRNAEERAIEVEKRRRTGAYQASQKESCPRHCHLERHGVVSLIMVFDQGAGAADHIN